MLADEAVDSLPGRSPGAQIPPPWWESREIEWMCVYTLFRLLHSHVGIGGGEKVADNPQAESHTCLANVRAYGKEARGSCVQALIRVRRSLNQPEKI